MPVWVWLCDKWTMFAESINWNGLRPNIRATKTRKNTESKIQRWLALLESVATNSIDSLEWNMTVYRQHKEEKWFKRHIKFPPETFKRIRVLPLSNMQHRSTFIYICLWVFNFSHKCKCTWKYGSSNKKTNNDSRSDDDEIKVSSCMLGIEYHLGANKLQWLH